MCLSPAQPGSTLAVVPAAGRRSLVPSAAPGVASPPTRLLWMSPTSLRWLQGRVLRLTMDYMAVPRVVLWE
jgi:hypothetical protein